MGLSGRVMSVMTGAFFCANKRTSHTLPLESGGGGHIRIPCADPSTTVHWQEPSSITAPTGQLGGGLAGSGGLGVTGTEVPVTPYWERMRIVPSARTMLVGGLEGM